MCDVFERAIDHWRATGAQVRSPASESEIEDTFAALDFPLTDDVRRLYSLADGFEDWEQNSCFWWWSLECLRDQNDSPRRDPGTLDFADYLISSHEYCFRRSEGNGSAVYVHHWYPKKILSKTGMRRFVPLWIQDVLGLPDISPDDLGTHAYCRISDSLPDFLEKYLHNPEDVEVY